MVTWNWTTELKSVAQGFKGSSKDSALIQFSIKNGCFNAGKINNFGKSAYEEQKESLIPAYSACYIKVKEEKSILLYLARNNKKIQLRIVNITLVPMLLYLFSILCMTALEVIYLEST